MNSLVTGAAGFIGGHLIKRLVQEQHHVRALVFPGDDVSELHLPGVEIIQGDVLDYPSVERAAIDCQVIFHLAKREGVQYPRQLITAVNAQGSLHVARAALHVGAKRLVHASTGGIYGRAVRNRVITDETRPRPHTVYSKSKLQAEKMLLDLHRRYELAVVIPRISQVLGPRAMSWLNLFQTIAAGRFRLMSYGGGSHQVVDVSDVVDGLMRCAMVKGIEGRTYILAGQEPVLFQDLIRMISDSVGTPLSAKLLPAAPYLLYGILADGLYAWTGLQFPRADRIDFYFADRTFDLSQSRRDLGYSPKVSAKEAVQRTAGWFKAQGYLS